MKGSDDRRRLRLSVPGLTVSFFTPGGRDRPRRGRPAEETENAPAEEAPKTEEAPPVEDLSETEGVPEAAGPPTPEDEPPAGTPPAPPGPEGDGAADIVPEPRRRDRRRGLGWRLLGAALGLALFAAAGQVAWTLYSYRANAESNDRARELAGLPAEPSVTDAAADPAPSSAPETEQPDAAETMSPEEAARRYVELIAGADLEALREVNSQVFGWIVIPDGGVSHPLVQAGDNQYYLSHAWDGSRSSAGAIFLECTNSRELTDFNTLIYGHNMRDGSMFTVLKLYAEQEYWQGHRDIYIATEGRVRRYEVFAAWEPKVTDIPYRTDLDSVQRRQEFIETCLGRSQIETGIVPEPEDHILTLSTCTGRGGSTRWIVQAVLRDTWAVEREETGGTGDEG